MSNFTIPTLHTYVEIVDTLIESWSTCVPWAQPAWAGQFIFVFCCIATIFYIYVLSVIVVTIRRRNGFKNPFYKCILVLSIGDLVVIITSSKEGAVQSCALASFSDRHLAWESIGAFSIDLIISLNLVIGLIRLRAVTILNKGDVSAKSYLMDGLILASFFWSLTMGIIHHFGLIKKIWYPKEAEYHDAYFFPFDYIRTPMHITEVIVTLLVYILAFINLQKIKHVVASSKLKHEYRFLALAIMLFISELSYIYATNWIGLNVFDIGSGEFNANLNYIVRPLVTGITPIYYILFSTEIRNAVLFKFNRSSKTGAFQATTSSRVSAIRPASQM